MSNLVVLLRQLLVLSAMMAVARFVVAEEPRRIRADEPLPIQEKPIDYFSTESQDPIARLNRRIEDERLKFEFSDRFGYLPAVLKELALPISSQLLRPHSMGLVDGPRISVQRPLALYFDDNAVVRWSPESRRIEIAAQDSQKGTLFYTLANLRDVPLRFERPNVCMSCHNQNGWLHSGIAAPGHIVHAGVATATKFPLGTLMTHTLPIEYRWTGQYVTETSVSQKHRGNEVWDNDSKEPRQVLNVNQEIDVDRYLIDTSDAVAHMVFDHQAFGQNLLSRLSYEHQSHVRSKIETIVVRYLLLVDEAPLDHPTSGKSVYAD